MSLGVGVALLVVLVTITVQLLQLRCSPTAVLLYWRCIALRRRTLNLSIPGIGGIGEAGAVAVAKALESGRCLLTSLDLKNNYIGDAGAAAVAKALESERCLLTSLSLHGSGIGEAGAVAVAKALGSGRCLLTSLDLTCNYIGDIGDAGAVAVAKALESGRCLLTSLDLRDNDIGEAGGLAIAKALESGRCLLTSLDLWSNRISWETQRHIDFILPLSAAAPLLCAQCRLAFAKGCCSSRLGEHSVLLDWFDTDCIRAVASYCSGRLVLGVLIERAAREKSEGERKP